MALALSNWTRDIVICTNGDAPNFDEELCSKLDALDIPVLAAPIECVNHVDGHCSSINLDGGMTLDCDKIFFALSQRPADDLAAQLDCERDDDGHVLVDAHYHTSVFNVFAAGDIVPGPQLAIAGAADGAIAALSLHRSLLPDERKLEKRDAPTHTPPAPGSPPRYAPAASR
jgi:thioredoxin reductase